MTKTIHFNIGHILMLLGLMLTLVVTSTSGVWLLTNEIRSIDSRLSKIEGILSVDRQPLLANTVTNTNTNYNR